MSLASTERITCPKCGAESDFTIWQSLNTMLDPDRKEAFLSGELFHFTCPGCGYASKINYPMLYHQMEDRIMVYYIQDEEEMPKVVDMFSGDYFRSSDKDLSAAEDIIMESSEEYIKRVVPVQNEMIEKAHIFNHGRDDRIIEMMKVILTGKIYKERPDMEVFLLLYDDEGDSESFVLLGEEKVLGAVEFPEDLYDGLLESFRGKLSPLRGGEDYLIDLSWAAGMLGINEESDAT